jgi:hypothetical protein
MKTPPTGQSPHLRLICTATPRRSRSPALFSPPILVKYAFTPDLHLARSSLALNVRPAAPAGSTHTAPRHLTSIFALRASERFAWVAELNFDESVPQCKSGVNRRPSASPEGPSCPSIANRKRTTLASKAVCETSFSTSYSLISCVNSPTIVFEEDSFSTSKPAIFRVACATCRPSGVS